MPGWQTLPVHALHCSLELKCYITSCSGHSVTLRTNVMAITIHHHCKKTQTSQVDESNMQQCHKKGPLMLHLNCFSLHINWTSPCSSGSLHFSSTEEQSTTSGFKNKLLASLYSQPSGTGCFYMKARHTHTHTHRIRTKPCSCGWTTGL